MDTTVVNQIVDVSPVLDEAIKLIVLIAGGIGTWLIYKLVGLAKLSKDNVLTQQLLAYMHNGINLAADKLKAEGKDLSEVKVKNELVEKVAEYIISQAPALIAYFKLEDRLRAWIEAHLIERADIPTNHMVTEQITSVAAVSTVTDAPTTASVEVTTDPKSTSTK